MSCLSEGIRGWDLKFLTFKWGRGHHSFTSFVLNFLSVLSGSHYVAQAVLELAILLPQPPKVPVLQAHAMARDFTILHCYVSTQNSRFTSCYGKDQSAAVWFMQGTHRAFP